MDQLFTHRVRTDAHWVFGYHQCFVILITVFVLNLFITALFAYLLPTDPFQQVVILGICLFFSVMYWWMQSRMLRTCEVYEVEVEE
jgi:hypothetical protein